MKVNNRTSALRVFRGYLRSRADSRESQASVYEGKGYDETKQ